MNTLSERIEFLISQRHTLGKWVGAYDSNSLRKWLDAELGDARRLEEWVGGARVVPRHPVLHVVSGNTPHAAFQTVFRALLVGSRPWVKVPSAGLPEFEEWASGNDLLDLRRDLPAEWRAPEAAVIYGGAETMGFFRSWLAPGTRITEHGPKLSAAFVFAEREGIFRDLAADVMRHGQRGCLSVRMIYLRGGDPGSFCGRLAEAMAAHPREGGEADLSEAGAVRNEREIARFRIANGEDMAMWESGGNTDWTVIRESGDHTLRGGPTCGFVRVVPMPDILSTQALGPESAFLSTAVVEPITEAGRLDTLSPPRICSAGNAQEPGILWHPDGEMPLAGLVRWRDLG